VDDLTKFNFLHGLMGMGVLRLKMCALGALLGFASSAFSAELPELKDLQNDGALVSALVVDLESGKVIASHNAEKRLTPASLTKVVLGAAALEKWGSDYTFKTRIFSNGTRSKAVIKGDLIVVGSGDPYLTNEKLWFLATDVARAGVREVSGNLVLNVSAFGDVVLDGNRRAGKRLSSHAYDSPLSAAAVNFSVLAAVASPSAEVGGDAYLALEPYDLSTAKIVGQASTVSQQKAAKISATRVRAKGLDEIRVSGSVSANDFPQRVYRSVSDADEYAGSVFLAFLREAGVRINGKVVVSREAPSQRWVPVAEVEGFPLDWQLRGLFKVSNNFIGDMLTIGLARETENSRGATLEAGAAQLELYMKDVLKSSSWKPASELEPLRLESGSGLTPENRMSAKDIVSVLDRMYRNSREFPSFYAALPIPGSEGTVRRRFSEANEKHLRNAVRAKTGTLSEPFDAVGLAGYVRSPKGSWIAFSAIVNGSQKKPSVGVSRIRDAIDSDLATVLPMGR
jgi:D-alanyl-D-alanine carboxypeptidase/D-alanyl-D-alanine-endopeptidase (penicillin-binding protein 4)